MTAPRNFTSIAAMLFLGANVAGFGQSSDLSESGPTLPIQSQTPAESDGNVLSESSPTENTATENESAAASGESSSHAVEEIPSNQSATSAVVSGNPAVSNLFVGSGWLGNALGLNTNGFRFAGINITDGNGVMRGGLAPGSWTCDSLTIAELTVDAEKFLGWKGALFGTEFLYYSGGNVNENAGVLMGYNSLSSVRPHNRAELYELWYRQELFEKKLVIRIGKSVASYDFNNVTRPITTTDASQSIPTVSSAIFTPLYVSPTVLGIWPGYYNSACGITTTFAPTENYHFQYACYDGNVANNRQTGFEGPNFNGYYLHLAEANTNWRIGAQNKPGAAGIGGWHQTGQLTAPSGPEQGADGWYCFGSQRLYYERPGESNNGLNAYLQFAATDTDRAFTHRYIGAGLSYIGPIPRRDSDAAGFSMAHGKMNSDPNAGAIFNPPPPGVRNQRPLAPDETILTWYYQLKVYNNTIFQPNLSYIISPARVPGTPDALAITLRAIMLF